VNSEFYVATHCLLLLACEPASVLTSGRIASQLSVHPVRIRKALGLLKKAGYISSREGLNGGFTLAIDPAKITLEQIYSLTEPNILKIRCKTQDSSSCPVDSNIGEVLTSVFSRAENSLLQQLKDYTLKSVMNEIYALKHKPCSCGRKTKQV
jgi:Rrf2 family protein